MHPVTPPPNASPRALALAFATALAVGCSGEAIPPTDTGGPAPDAAADVAPDTTVGADATDDDSAGASCPAGQLYCLSPREAARCNPVGDGPEATTPCRGATACEPATGLCRPTICEPDKQHCLTLSTYQVCHGDGSGWGESQRCATDRFCADGQCRACPASKLECLSEHTFRQCAADSSAWSAETTCPGDGRCIGQACEPCDLQVECLGTTQLHRYCQDPAANFDETVTCPAGHSCQAGGCYRCTPGEVACASETRSRRCQADGLGWEASAACGPEETCFGGACQPYACVPRVLLLVDQSGSMNTHWDTVQSSIAALVSGNPTLRFGLKSFPTAGANCHVDASLQVAFAQLNTGAFDAWFEGHGPGGATPLAAAMEAVLENATSYFGAFGGSVIVLSDGDDTCHVGGSIKADLANATSGLFMDHSVTTYVIGYAFGGDAEELNTIANNGGTSIHSHIAAGNEAELTAALAAVVDDLKLCGGAP